MIDWSPLRTALARCRASNTPIPVWWRDDDAIEPTAALDQLSEMSAKVGVPVYLATIPQPARNTLVSYLQNHPNLIPCVHGWAHKNTAPPADKKSEFGRLRKGAEQELKLALNSIQQMFGEKALALFVPPWNRMHESYQTILATHGYIGFSTFGARPKTSILPQINTHIDPIFWRGHRGLVDPEQLIHQAVETLTNRYNGVQDTNEPLGLLTHHLVHVPEVWKFSAAFMSEMLDGGAIPANLKEILT